MDLLGDLLRTRPIQKGWEFTIEPFPSWWFGFIENLDRQFGNRLVWTRTHARIDCPEPSLTLVESFLCKPKSSVFPYTDCIHIVIQLTRTAESGVLHTTLPTWPLTLLQNPETSEYHEIGCPSDWYTALGDSSLSTICNKLSLNWCNFNYCPSPRSQLYPLSKSCKIYQHTDNSLPHRHHSYPRPRGILN